MWYLFEPFVLFVFYPFNTIFTDSGWTGADRSYSLNNCWLKADRFEDFVGLKIRKLFCRNWKLDSKLVQGIRTNGRSSVSLIIQRTSVFVWRYIPVKLKTGVDVWKSFLFDNKNIYQEQKSSAHLVTRCIYEYKLSTPLRNCSMPSDITRNRLKAYLPPTWRLMYSVGRGASQPWWVLVAKTKFGTGVEYPGKIKSLHVFGEVNGMLHFVGSMYEWVCLFFCLWLCDSDILKHEIIMLDFWRYFQGWPCCKWCIHFGSLVYIKPFEVL